LIQVKKRGKSASGSRSGWSVGWVMKSGDGVTESREEITSNPLK
jgi:hypothetical protein